MILIPKIALKRLPKNKKDRDLYYELKDLLNFSPKNLNKYKKAFPHRSVQMSDKKGNPMAYEYFDVHSRDFMSSVVKKINPKSKIKFIKDNFFNKKLIMNKKEKKLASTRVINGMQVADLLILPHQFVIIKK